MAIVSIVVRWRNVECVRSSVCVGTRGLKLVVHGGSYSGLRKGCVGGVVCVC